MDNQKTSVLTNGLIWFGAATSIAEILTGTFLAPLGFKKAVAAILIGHAIGVILMFIVGFIGAKTEKSSMETVKQSFGNKGGIFFSSLNVMQLVGWTAIMILSGASAANAIFSRFGPSVWALVIGGLIVVWIYIGLKNMSKINMLAMGGLFILTMILSGIVFQGDLNQVVEGEMTFGSAVELSIAMPLSWLPLISDYTRNVKKKVSGVAVSAISYGLFSSWMYVIGLGATIFTGNGDVAQIMLTAGLGIVGLLIIVLSTVTTTFLDVYSAGVSAVSISSKVNEKSIAIAVTFIGTVLAIFTPISQMESFLYLIGSVFAPMIAIQISNYYLVKENYESKSFAWINVILWCVGFGIYRAFMSVDTPIGSTVPVIGIIILLDVFLKKILLKNKFMAKENVVKSEGVKEDE
jgi:putative hydroxymethylpyrimidine transporter CytX